jgi:hypothetical protein
MELKNLCLSVRKVLSMSIIQYSINLYKQEMNMAYILLALAACFWGGNYVVSHILVANSNPMILSERRWAITALLLHLLYHKQVINDLSKIKKSFKTTLFLSLFG